MKIKFPIASYFDWERFSLKQRTVSAVIYAAVLAGCILWNETTYFFLIAIISNVCLFEFNRLLGYSLRTRRYSYAIHNLAIASVSGRYYPSFLYPWADYLWMGVVLVVFAVFAVELFSEHSDPSQNLGKLFLSTGYITSSFVLSLLIPFTTQYPTYVYQIVLGVFLLIWANDTFAFLVGVRFGKHKLIERISPKKTVEGLCGGAAGTMLTGYVLSHWLGILSWWDWMAVALIVAVAGTLGDLIESMFKRQAGVKDSGTKIPGHGGLLDRLDSFIFAVPFVYAYLYFRLIFIY